jgi:LmbE family N-acetylglucosaminyl deacetylase
MKQALLAVLAHPDDESFGIGGTLARYVREGVDVHVAIATDGIAGSVVDAYEEKTDQLVAIRMQELEAAVDILGCSLHKFCYRDSGHIGDPANDHESAFIHADEYEATGRVVQLIRETRPQVIITHDDTGGYFHPDHVKCWKITTAAFHAAGDPQKYPEIDLTSYQPQRLYYTAFPRHWVAFFSKMMRLLGRDPTKIGRNEDIDLTGMGVPRDRIHAWVDFRHYWEIKAEAGAQHVSQGGGVGFGRLLPNWLLKRFFGRESYTRAYPPVDNGYHENDLFAGVEM